MSRMMILKGGSPAIHKLGDIGRSVDDKIRVHSETNTHYIGNFEEGFGFVDVKFRKEDCRLLTEEEVKELNGTWYTINGRPLYRIYVDKYGNVINGKGITVKGTIIKVTDNDGYDKHLEFVGLNVEFGEDIQIGQNIVMLTKKGTITTSKVINFEIINNEYFIQTKNSLYVIKINK